MSQKKCEQKEDCAGKTTLLIVSSLIFMVATSCVYGFFLGMPVSIFMSLVMPEVFSTFGKALICTSASISIVLLAITVVSRLVHIFLDGGSYIRNTFYYDYISS